MRALGGRVSGGVKRVTRLSTKDEAGVHCMRTYLAALGRISSLVVCWVFSLGAQLAAHGRREVSVFAAHRPRLRPVGHILAWSVWLPCLPPSSGRGNGGWWFAWVGFGATLRGCATRRHGSSPSSRMVHNTRTTFVLCVAVASPCEDLDSPIGASDGDSASVPGQILKSYS